MSNLIICRTVGEGIQIGKNIRVVVSSRKGGQIKILVNAPKNIKVSRIDSEVCAQEYYPICDAHNVSECFDCFNEVDT